MARFSPAVRPTNTISTSTVANWFGNQFVLIPGSYESIATVSAAAGGSSSLTFSSIPSTYTHLQIRGIVRTNRNLYVDYYKFNFNSDTSANYSAHALYGDGSSVLTSATTSGTSIDVARSAGNTSVANGFGLIVMDILDYQNTNKYKTTKTLAGYDDNGQGQLWFQSGLWMNTNAITNITIAPGVGTSFLQYTQFALYGIKGA